MSIEEEVLDLHDEEENSVGSVVGSEAAGEDEAFDDEQAFAAQAASGEAGLYNANDVVDTVFEELHLNPAIVEEVVGLWNAFLQSGENREAAGEAIYAALFDAAPSLQSLFKTPRAVMAMRLMTGLHQIINALGDPKQLKVIVETLGFQHLDLEVTVPRVVIFRDAIVDLMQVELGSRCTEKAMYGWSTVLNYVGGAYIYVRVKFSERLKVLSSSWAEASNKKVEPEEGESEAGAVEGATGALEEEEQRKEEERKRGELNKKGANDSKSKGRSFLRGKSGIASAGKGAGEGDEAGRDFRNALVPKTFKDMFVFNAAVMGFGGNHWMQEILSSFDTIVSNVSNIWRLQEECDILSLRMAKYKGTINLTEYKTVMLASLRSLVKDWGSAHEVSWSWLWENVERMLKQLMGKPAGQEAALSALLASLDEASLMVIRREVYSKFFAFAPAGQDYFKQSTTRLHFIADKLVVMTLDMYREPKRMVEDLSAMGLRHVGYGIPTDLFGPFVTACVQVVRTLTDDDKAEEAFRWSLSLISRILQRVITEGSTIVMKAINANSGKLLRRAVACAPRGKRALWTLNVQVGTQSISPLMWAIETGSLEAAEAIIVDLLTIRADRDRYYYGMDIMFERHPDIIKRICLEAPALMPVLLDGLIWRSRATEQGLRRVNYYIKHLIIGSDGGFSKSTEWIVENQDPAMVCHPVVAIVTDMVWSRIALRNFMYGKTWFLFTLVIFVLSQSILKHLGTSDDTGLESESSSAHSIAVGHDTPEEGSVELRVSIFACRLFIYLFSMGSWIHYHSKCIVRDCRNRALFRVGCIRVPDYLKTWQDAGSFSLMVCLLVMLCMEPIFHCARSMDGVLFTEHCADGERLHFSYSVLTTIAMLLYFLLLSDLAVFSTRVSAFVLVCGRVLSEVALFLFGLTFFVVAFACSVSALDQNNPRFSGVPKSILNLYRISFGMFSGEHFDALSDDPALFVSIFFFVIATVVFLFNLLIAQLSCSYQSTYQDMLGFARLNRGKIVTETMSSVSKVRWHRFVDSLRLEDRSEFGEGDIGLPGAVQIFEPASANITTEDTIQRFGGSTSPAAQWPETKQKSADEVDRFDRMEKLIEKAMKRMTKKGGRRGGSSGAGGSSMSGSVLSSGGDESGAYTSSVSG